MKELIANSVFRIMAAFGLRTFAAQFLVSFILILALFIGIGLGIFRALEPAPEWLEAGEEAQPQLQQVSMAAAAYAAEGESRRTLERSLDSLQARMERLSRAAPDGFAATGRAWERYEQQLQQLLDDRESVTLAQLMERSEAASEALSGLVAEGREAQQGHRELMLYGALVLLLGTIALLLIGRVYGNFHFMDQVDRLRLQLNKVAEGDFSQKLSIEIRENEVGQMLAAYNTMLEHVGQLLGDIRDATENAGIQLQQVVDTTGKTHRGAEQQNSDVYEAASAMNQMSSSIQEVAGNAQNAADSARDAAASAKEGHQVADQARSRIDNLDTRFNETARTMESLESDANDVSNVLTVIREIADQTNLLALNAAIEAARAGDSGRGFAVVAEEVRNLAQRTQDSTNQIQETIERLQGQVRTLVSESEASAEASRESVDSVTRTSEAIDSILGAIENIQGMNDQIAAAVEEQSSVADNISERMRAISEVASHTDQDARQTVDSNDAIRRELERLRQTIERFNA